MVVREYHDADALWLFREMKNARTVGAILTRYSQYQNKIRALQQRYEKEHDLHRYARNMEVFIQGLTAYPWDMPLIDVRPYPL